MMAEGEETVRTVCKAQKRTQRHPLQHMIRAEAAAMEVDPPSVRPYVPACAEDVVGSESTGVIRKNWFKSACVEPDLNRRLLHKLLSEELDKDLCSTTSKYHSIVASGNLDSNRFPTPSCSMVIDLTESDLDLIIGQVEAAWAIAAVEVFLYGSVTSARQQFLTGSTISLFILSTVHCALVLASTILQARMVNPKTAETSQRDVNASLVCAASAVYILSKCVIPWKQEQVEANSFVPSVIADSIFGKIIILPTLLTLAVGGASMGLAFGNAVL
ncbi:hypothetical protein B0H17DRAFT_1136559 [Mycena rosella]|uniref:Uncharacterized protein n=1 Tax=Mycena rosella TaxID=1033263 RepID=A0AAD7GFZ1_MYCRO|nr:hypothetical protein B0H17DRAFT_1136559 [Mycena rosella]